MNSDRHAVQLFVESRIGCASSDQLAGLVGCFEAYEITHQDLPQVKAALIEDAEAYFRKGVSTTLQALAGLDQGHESWALIKLYYAVYFFLRESLAVDGVSVLRCRNIYTLDADYAAKPLKRTGTRFRGDHVATISLHKDRFDGRDILNSQRIEELNPYDWLRDKREWINYRRRLFIDGAGINGSLSHAIPYADQISRYCEDQIPIFCFDADYAALALPIKRFQSNLLARVNAVSLIDDCLLSMPGIVGRSPSCKALLAAVQ
jgi:hypothetical protein